MRSVAPLSCRLRGRPQVQEAFALKRSPRRKAGAPRAKARGAVDNTLVEEHASDESSVITTDGAGRATVSVTAVGACEGRAAGDVVATPVTIDTEFGRVVEGSAGLTVDVACAGPAPIAPSDGGAAPSAPTTGTPSGATKASGLARTGFDGGSVLLFAGLLLGASAVALAAKQR